jgi:hypothetical protein
MIHHTPTNNMMLLTDMTSNQPDMMSRPVKVRAKARRWPYSWVRGILRPKREDKIYIVRGNPYISVKRTTIKVTSTPPLRFSNRVLGEMNMVMQNRDKRISESTTVQ